MSKANFISVILPLKLEWEPCYSLPESISPDQVAIGTRVKVMFANKEYSAVVSDTGITPDTDPKKIKEIVCIESGLQPILAQEIELWRAVSSYYMCSIGEVYKAAYPISKINLEESRAAAAEKAEQRKERIIASLKARIERIEERLQKKLRHAEEAKEGTKSKARLSEEAERIHTELSLAKSALEAAEHDNPKPDPTQTDVHTCNVELSPAQQKAYHEIKEGFTYGKPVLLNGITGSGKTEIYISLAQDILSKGKNVLYLVPEIALSRQLEDRLRQHFGEALMTFHSGETATSKMNTAESIRSLNGSKSGYIVLGTRSSLFLPHNNLGLIIVDEEHDNSYKQDSPAPRYNGRDTALMLHLIHNCSIILGSATPSLEEQYNCLTGKHSQVNLSERYHGSEEADTEIIDTKAERRKRGIKGSFSIKLIDHISRTLERGEQVIILRARRAWASMMQCESCGSIVRCPHCNVSLSRHNDGRSICHYCGYSQPYIASCQKCGGNLLSLGAGTQRIEDEAAELFPHARIARLDSDTTQSKTFETKTIRDFSNGEIDILIGTQIVTKGFDFSKLSLVAVIAADTLLGMQDFRADEKALQLLEQFKGRCGRRERKGLLVIQTSQPEHPIYQRIISKNTDSFTSELMLERKEFNFPPYSRIIELTIKDLYEDRAERMASALCERLTADLQRAGIKDIGNTLTGPYAPAVDKVADRYIRTIRVSLRKDRNLTAGKALIKSIVERFEKERKYDGHITINVDPS